MRPPAIAAVDVAKAQAEGRVRMVELETMYVDRVASEAEHEAVKRLLMAHFHLPTERVEQLVALAELREQRVVPIAQPLVDGVPDRLARDGAPVRAAAAHLHVALDHDHVRALLGGEHGSAFAAIAQRGHVAGAQFHPERSAAVGARLLQNFIE